MAKKRGKKNLPPGLLFLVLNTVSITWLDIIGLLPKQHFSLFFFSKFNFFFLKEKLQSQKIFKWIGSSVPLPTDRYPEIKHRNFVSLLVRWDRGGGGGQHTWPFFFWWLDGSNGHPASFFFFCSEPEETIEIKKFILVEVLHHFLYFS